MSLLRNGSVFVGAALCVCLASEAQAHWCDDLWASSYNIVVRPESDTVTVPASGSANMTIWVQNNMGYLLPNFKLGAKVGSTTITPSAGSTKVSGTLLPGERVKYSLPVSKSGGGSVSIQDITFSVSFGNSGQAKCYPTKNAKAVIVKMAADGSLFPGPPQPGLDTPQNPGCTGDVSQGYSLQYEAIADFENVDTGLDKLLQLYCAGRKSWDSGSADVITTSCKDTSSTTCSTRGVTNSASKYDYMRLWAASELAIRKASLGGRLAVFRQRLQCAIDDPMDVFSTFAAFMLGYLGSDDGAKTILQSKAGGTGDLASTAKAALYMMGDSAQQSAVKTCAQSGGTYAKLACAAALGIVDKDDTTVGSVLIPAAQWEEPDPDNGQGLYASHLLAVVAWDRRGWAAKSGETGSVTFYGESGSPSNGGNSGGTGGSGAGGAPVGGASGVGGATGVGGASGSGGNSGKDGGASDAKTGTGGGPGAGGGPSVGGGPGVGGGPAAGGSTLPGTGGKAVPGLGGGNGPASGGGSPAGSGGAAVPGGNGGASGSGGGGPGGTSTPSSLPGGESTSGCKCNLGHSVRTSFLSIVTLLGLGLAVGRRRRR